MSRLPSPRAAPIPWISALVIATALIVGTVVIIHRHRSAPLSDPVSRPAPELGGNAQQLKPNLREAVLVAIDRPHNRSELEDHGRRGRITRQRRFTVSTNSLGFRGPEIDVPAEEIRIVCVGDSVTFGWGVTYEQSWPARLERVLGVDVVNAGWPAAEPGELLAWVRGHAAELDPDIVLLCKGQPDEEGQVPFGSELAEIATSLAPTRLGYIEPPIGTFDMHAVDDGEEEEETEEGSPLSWLPPAVPGLSLTPRFRAQLPLPGVTGELDSRVQRMRRWPGGQVIVEAATPPEGLADEIIAAFEADPTLREPLFIDEGHPDPNGYALFAREVAAWLRGLGWIPEGVERAETP